MIWHGRVWSSPACLLWKAADLTRGPIQAKWNRKLFILTGILAQEKCDHTKPRKIILQILHRIKSCNYPSKLQSLFMHILPSMWRRIAAIKYDVEKAGRRFHSDQSKQRHDVSFRPICKHNRSQQSVSYPCYMNWHIQSQHQSMMLLYHSLLSSYECACRSYIVVYL